MGSSAQGCAGRAPERPGRLSPPPPLPALAATFLAVLQGQPAAWQGEQGGWRAPAFKTRRATITPHSLLGGSLLSLGSHGGVLGAGSGRETAAERVWRRREGRPWPNLAAAGEPRSKCWPEPASPASLMCHNQRLCWSHDDRGPPEASRPLFTQGTAASGGRNCVQPQARLQGRMRQLWSPEIMRAARPLCPLGVSRGSAPDRPSQAPAAPPGTVRGQRTGVPSPTQPPSASPPTSLPVVPPPGRCCSQS